jgi:hypothetical protein
MEANAIDTMRMNSTKKINVTKTNVQNAILKKANTSKLTIIVNLEVVVGSTTVRH